MRKNWEDRAAFLIPALVTLALVLEAFSSNLRELRLETTEKIAGILESLAVIASVIYLGVQVKLSTKATKGATYQNIVASFAAVSARVSESKELADIYLAGRNGDALKPDEQLRFNQLMSSFFDVHENLYYHYRQGLLDDDLWDGWNAVLRLYLSRPGSRKWWDGSAVRYGESFRNHVEELKHSTPVDESRHLVTTGTPATP